MPTQAPSAGARQFFSRRGTLSKWHPGYEYRPGRMEMAEAVESSLAGKRHLIVEAGTGRRQDSRGPAFTQWLPRLPRQASGRY